MRRKILAVCLAFLMIFLVLSTVYVGTVVGVNEAEMPKYSVGDKWKFNVDYKEEIGLLGTGTFEITGDSVDIFPFEEHYVCYEIKFTGNGTVYGQNVTGTWTMNIVMYAQKSDLSDVESTSTTYVTFTYAGESHIMKIVTGTTYDPPLGSGKGYTLTTGKSWSATTTETEFTETTIDGDIDKKTDNTTYTRSYLVLRTELTTVSAGEFETFVIKATDPDGSYSENYYSPEAGFSVKGREYDETGKLVMTMELLEYSYAAAEEGFPWLWIIIGIVIAAAVIAGGVGYVLYRRRKPTAPAAPPTPLTEQPTPPSSNVISLQ